MTEDEFTEHLKKKDDNQNLVKTTNRSVYNISIPSATVDYPDTAFQQSDTTILPLSVYDEASTSGTAAILQQFMTELRIKPHSVEEVHRAGGNSVDINARRDQYLFYQGLEELKTDMIKLKKDMANNEKQYATETHHEDSESENEDLDTAVLVGKKFKERCIAKQKHFESVYCELQSAIIGAEQIPAVMFLLGQISRWMSLVDQFGRTALHVAVEEHKKMLAEVLLLSGANPNAEEGCGLTPVMISIVKNDIDMSKLLLKFGARVSGTFSALLPSPVQLAESLKETNPDLNKLINESCESTEKAKEDILITVLYPEYDNGGDYINVITELDGEQSKKINNKNLVPIFGDQKTCANIRSVRNRAPAEFGPFTEVPGDFHTIGYVMQSISKVHGTAGLYYVARQVLQRLKITPKSFQKIFKEGNYERNLNMMMDYFWGSGIALIKKFQASTYFPNSETLEECQKQSGNCNSLLISQLTEWISECSKNDATFKHHSKCVLKDIALLKIYQEQVRNGNGKCLEAIWLELLPLFAGTGRRNYKDEAFVHILNFLAAWPLAVREMLRRNRTVSIKGRKQHNVASDEWVEMCLVKPVKKYAKKQTTFALLEKITVNIDLLNTISKRYKEEFKVNLRTKSSYPDPSADQLKIAWFALKEGWYNREGRNGVKEYQSNSNVIDRSKMRNVRQDLLNVRKIGKDFIENNFDDMRCRLFPLCPPKDISNLEGTDDNI